MAEGDSIYRMARRIEAAFDGRKVLAAEAPNHRSPLRQRAERLDGLDLIRVESRGKHLIMTFDGELALHSHMGMNGSWQVMAEGERWRRSRRAAWLVLDLGDREVVQFGGPTLRLVNSAELGRDGRLARLGPDLLDPGFRVEAGTAALATAGDRELGEALMDQGLLAGIGNIFKSEACFEARLDPWRPVSHLDAAELELIVETARRQLRVGAETGRRPGRVYRRAGRPCPRCRARILSRRQGTEARTTYWCAHCQPPVSG